jgi:hypothetical protein
MGLYKQETTNCITTNKNNQHNIKWKDKCNLYLGLEGLFEELFGGNKRARRRIRCISEKMVEDVNRTDSDLLSVI